MSRVWAVAKNTLAQALRMKIAIVFILLLLILLPIMSVITTGDGTLKGKLQTFVSYGLGLMNFLLCFLTIIVASWTLSSDLKKNLLYTVVTKPLRRFELFLGKLVGIIMLDVILLICFGGLIYGLTVFMPKFTEPTAEQVVEANDEFFTARKEIEPVSMDSEIVRMAREIVLKTKENKKDYKEFQEKFPGKNDLEIMGLIASQIKAQSRSVPPGATRLWQFENVVPEDAKGQLFVQYKYEVSTTPPDEMVIGYWAVGDIRPAKLGEPIDPYERLLKDKAKTVHEFAVPASKAAIDGHLDILFENHYQNQTTVIFPEGEFKVLYKADTFTANFIRACIILLARLIFLSAVCVSLSAWLSFPVVILVSLVVFFTASISSFILDSFDYTEGFAKVFIFAKYIVYLMPRFDAEYNPSQFIVTGRLIEWMFLGKIYLMLAVIKGGIITLVGILIFNKREIAKVSA